MDHKKLPMGRADSSWVLPGIDLLRIRRQVSDSNLVNNVSSNMSNKHNIKKNGQRNKMPEKQRMNFMTKKCQ